MKKIKKTCNKYQTLLKKKAKRKDWNGKKTEAIVVSRNNKCPQINIFISGYKLKGINSNNRAL